jgi:RES domain
MTPAMHYPIGQGPLFRVASATSGNAWPDPVMGLGSYYLSRDGNRYSRPHRLTVYCAEDPLVAITEGAFYQALRWQNDIASFPMKTVAYPLRSEHLLWAFLLDPRPPLIDMESTLARHHFGYPPHLLLNPSRSDSGTQAMADVVRTYTPPAGSGQPNPEGMNVPSVRTPYAGGFPPHRFALFVMNTPASMPYDQRSRLVAKMKIEFEFEFLTHSPANPVGYSSPRINSHEPKFRVSLIPGEPVLAHVPAYPGRPQARTYPLNRWHRIRIVF